MGADYYKVLGVSKDVSDADLKKAYKRAALAHHVSPVHLSVFLIDQVRLTPSFFALPSPTATQEVKKQQRNSRK
jgi:hypothetical protein